MVGELPEIDGVDFGRLGEWMDGEGLPEGDIANAESLVGGSQNILVRFERGGEAYVLRRPPVHKRKNSDETMRREARVLAALAGSEVPHPGLKAACADEEVLGGAFYLMEPIDGFSAPTGLPELHANDSATRHRMGCAVAEGAAAVGAVDYRAVGLDGFGKPEGYLERQVGRWWSQLESYAEFEGYAGPSIPGAEDVAKWLDAHRPTQWSPGIIHGDYHLANVMYSPTSGELAAIVDWELSTVGDPLLDIGWLVATWPDDDGGGAGAVPVQPWAGWPTSEDLVAAYSAKSDRSLDAIDWYVVLACYKLGIILEGTHARASAGKASAKIGDVLHAQTLGLFDKAAKRIAGV